MWGKIKEIISEKFKQPWYAKYRDPWYKQIYYNWINFVYSLTSKHPKLQVLLCTLAELEVHLRLAKDQELFEKVDSAHCFNKELDDIIATTIIPKNTFYCQDCPFKTRSKIARFFFGDDFEGYCYFLGRGDFSYINPTDILWDGCKCCNVNDDFDEEEVVEEEELTFDDLGLDYKDYYGD